MRYPHKKEMGEIAMAFAVALLLITPLTLRGVINPERVEGLSNIARAQEIEESALPVSVPQNGMPTVTAAELYTSQGVPRILPRAIWENTSELRSLLTWFPEEDNRPPDYAPPERIIVHDLGCSVQSPACNSDTANPVALIQAVYRFHAIQQGWEDIGYNYIIDRQGRIYEGRFGGNGARGAHLYANRRCENFNVGSIGILLLGNYGSTSLAAGAVSPMPSAMEESLVRLSGWLSAANNLDPSAITTSNIWKSPRSQDGSCDISQGGFDGSFTGPTLISHGEIEAGNSDTFDFTAARSRAKAFTDSFQAFVYTDTDQQERVRIQNGTLAAVDVTLAQNPVVLAKTQLGLFPKQTLAKVPDGALLRSFTRENVYLIEEGKRRSIPTAELFGIRGFSWDLVQQISDRELALYPLAAPLPYPDGTLVKREGGNEVYKFEKGALRAVTATALFPILKLNPQKALPMRSRDINAYPQGEPILFPNKTLVKATTAPTVYLIENGTKRPISSEKLFKKLKLSFKKVQELTAKEISYYPQGYYVAWPNGTLLTADGDAKVWYLQGGFRRWIQNAKAFKALGFSWKAVNAVSVEELSGYREAQPIEKAKDLKLKLAEISASAGAVAVSAAFPSSSRDSAASEPLIRIALYSPKETDSVQLTPDSEYVIQRTGLPDEKKAALVPISVAPSRSIVTRIVPQSSGATIMLNSYSDPAYNGTNDNVFRGIVEIAYSPASQKFWVVNELLLESYLKGVAEMSNADPLEYQKAFAISARSYALQYIGKGGKRTGEIFTLTNTTADQWYKGYNFEKRAKTVAIAFEATRGTVAQYQNEPILAAYSSGAPGTTLSACAVWGGKFCEAGFAYLSGGIDDPSGTAFKNQSCGGAVHCVGLDADGARQMAMNGAAAETILKTYYPGIILTQVYK